MITDKDFNTLCENVDNICKDMKRVKNCLLGDQEYQQNGLVKRVKHLENISNKNEKIKIKLTGIAIGASLVFSGIIWIIEKFLT